MRSLLLCALAAVVAQDPQAPPRDKRPEPAAAASISGRITDAESGRPLANAVVHAASAYAFGPSGLPQSFQSETGPDGRYSITDLPAGDYRVFAAPGDMRGTHLSASFGPAAQAMSIVGRPSLTLAAGESRKDVDVALPRAYAIEGRVVDEFGEPMAEVGVSVVFPDGRGAFGGDRPTDDRGMFRLYGIPSGTYNVCGRPRAFRAPAEAGDAADVRYVETCHPAAPSGAGAREVTVSKEDVSGIEIQMHRSGTFTLSGHVATEFSAVSGRLRVGVSRLKPGGSSGVDTTVSGEAFTARGLTPGDYVVTASSGESGADDGEYGRARVRIDAADVTGLVVSTSRGATVRGRIVTDGAPLPASAVRGLRVGTREDMFAEDRFRMAPRHAAVAGDLSFMLTRIFEPVSIVIDGLPDGWAVASVRYGDADVMDMVTAFATSPEPDALRIAVTNRASRLSVRVVDSNGDPAAGFPLVLPADPARRPAGIRIFGRPTGPGEFDFGFLAPGEYLVAAVSPEAFRTPADRRTTLQRVAKMARRVRLTGNGSTSATVTVIPVDALR